MRSFWIVAGVVAFGIVLVQSLSALRQTRTYVYRGEFALEVPRDWEADPPSGTRTDLLRGRIRDGVRAQLTMQSISSSTPGYRYPDQPIEKRPSGLIQSETWARNGEFWSMEYGPTPQSPLGTDWVHLCRVHSHDTVFSAVFYVRRDPTEEDRALLERCLRSIRWVGR